MLVANRGEIALRIIRACRKLGIRSVAVYSDADAGALHVRAADQAVPIGPAPPRESYLSIERVVGAAREAGARPILVASGLMSRERLEATGALVVDTPAEAVTAALSLN